MTTFLNDDLAPADSDEQAEAMAHDALIYELSVVLMRLDGNEGDPHQLIWCGGQTPEPWGDAWQKYEEQAQAVLNAIGEGSAQALIVHVDAARGVAPSPTAHLSGYEDAVSTGNEGVNLGQLCKHCEITGDKCDGGCGNAGVTEPHPCRWFNGKCIDCGRSYGAPRADGVAIPQTPKENGDV